MAAASPNSRRRQVSLVIWATAPRQERRNAQGTYGVCKEGGGVGGSVIAQRRASFATTTPAPQRPAAETPVTVTVTHTFELPWDVIGESALCTATVKPCLLPRINNWIVCASFVLACQVKLATDAAVSVLRGTTCLGPSSHC